MNLKDPLQFLKMFPSYFAQTQLQTTYRDVYFCILLSYHPESKPANLFLIQKHNLLVDAIIDVCNFIYSDQIFQSWSHSEIKELQKIPGKPITYENLRTLKSYTRKFLKGVTPVGFVKEFKIK